ncbi:MAG: DUF6448 family protein [Micromonosporaceae bacterium]
MAPHCDSMDGPVVTAARKALEGGDVNVVLPFVTKDGEEEVVRAFEATERARRYGAEAQEVADLYFFETVVRVHRAGEGAPYTGLKPAGLGEGPVIPVAEISIDSGNSEQLKEVLANHVRDEVQRRFDHLMKLKRSAAKDVDHAREYVEAMLGLEVWANNLYETVLASAHAGHDAHHR